MRGRAPSSGSRRTLPDRDEFAPTTTAHGRYWRFLPAGTTRDAAVLIAARAVRAYADGFVSVLLPLYLTTRGLNGLQIGAVATAMLLGSAVLTLLVGLAAHRLRRRLVLLNGALLMAATGVGFALVRGFWPLLVVAFVGTLNPSSGDVSVFLPVEQSLLTQTVGARGRTALFARYGLVAALAGACGALSAGIPAFVAATTPLGIETALAGMFLLYTLLAVGALLLYRTLSPAIEPAVKGPETPLRESRRIVYPLAALFSLDALGGGFIVQSLFAFWLFTRYGLDAATAGAIFFWAGVLAAFSFPVAAWLAGRIGLVNTIVCTHLPANIFLILVPFMPNLQWAVALILARFTFAQMDVPTRNSYVMAVVTPPERPAAASVTSVPRSLAAAVAPLLSGWLLAASTFGWPLVIGGALKATYDLLLLVMFRSVRPPEES